MGFKGSVWVATGMISSALLLASCRSAKHRVNGVCCEGCVGFTAYLGSGSRALFGPETHLPDKAEPPLKT